MHLICLSVSLSLSLSVCLDAVFCWQSQYFPSLLTFASIWDLQIHTFCSRQVLTDHICACRFSWGVPRMPVRQWSTLVEHLVCHRVIPSLTYVLKVASLRKLVVDVTAEASRFDYSMLWIKLYHLSLMGWMSILAIALMDVSCVRSSLYWSSLLVWSHCFLNISPHCVVLYIWVHCQLAGSVCIWYKLLGQTFVSKLRSHRIQ